LRRQKRKRRSGGAAERLDEAEWKMYREAMRLEKERQKRMDWPEKL